jgi:hypothetical protein
MEDGLNDYPVYGIEIDQLKVRGIFGRVDVALNSKYLKVLRESRGRENISIVYASSTPTHLLSEKKLKEVLGTPAFITRKNGSLYIFINHSYYEEVKKDRSYHYDVVIAHEVAHTFLDEIKNDDAHNFSDCSEGNFKEESQADFIAGMTFYHISYHRRKKVLGSKIKEISVLNKAMKAYEEALDYVGTSHNDIALRVQSFKQGWDSVPKS